MPGLLSFVWSCAWGGWVGGLAVVWESLALPVRLSVCLCSARCTSTARVWSCAGGGCGDWACVTLSLPSPPVSACTAAGGQDSAGRYTLTVASAVGR